MVAEAEQILEVWVNMDIIETLFNVDCDQSVTWLDLRECCVDVLMHKLWWFAELIEKSQILYPAEALVTFRHQRDRGQPTRFLLHCAKRQDKIRILY